MTTDMDHRSEPDLQPTLAGETVILWPIAPADWAAMFAAASDQAAGFVTGQIMQVEGGTLL